MNIRRGLWRLWIVGTVLWIVTAGPTLWFIADIPKQIDRISAFSGIEDRVAQLESRPLKKGLEKSDLETAMAALRAADKAGNVEDAQRLAAEVRRLSKEQPAWAQGPIVEEQIDWEALAAKKVELPPGFVLDDQLAKRKQAALLTVANRRLSAAWSVIGFYAMGIFVPPIVILIMGLLGLWIAKGFRQSEASP